MSEFKVGDEVIIDNWEGQGYSVFTVLDVRRSHLLVDKSSEFNCWIGVGRAILATPTSRAIYL